MHTKGGKSDGNMASKTWHGIPPERSGKNGSEGIDGTPEKPGQGQYLFATRGVCHGCGRSGHYKKWCPYREQDEGAAKGGDPGVSVETAA